MYAAVAARTREIATLRALGFSRLSILVSFVMESTLLGFFGGLAGLILGTLAVKLAFSGVTGTTNFATFSEVIFAFRLTPALLIWGLVFSIFMGFFGGLLPAWRGGTMRITTALRQVG
jgi:ABC-type antimicrobial peptide transport system permease subunit